MLATPPDPAGLASTDLDALAAAILQGWDDFLTVVRDPATDLSRPSRLDGWTGRDVCVHLGEWDDLPTISVLVASAEDGGQGEPTPVDEANRRVLEAHRDASDAEVVEAVQRGRDGVAALFASPDWARLGPRPAVSSVGPLPLAGLLHAGSYELAVHALDLAPCGAPPPSEHLLDRGLAALLDVTGSLAHSEGVSVQITGASPQTAWSFRSDAQGWTTERATPGEVSGAGVEGETTVLLDASAGRAQLPPLLLSRAMKVSKIRTWMKLAPIIEHVPNLPGGPVLKTGIHGLSGAGKLLSRFGG